MYIYRKKGFVLQIVIWGFLVHLQKGLVLQIVIWGFLVHGVRITGVRFVTRTNPDCPDKLTGPHAAGGGWEAAAVQFIHPADREAFLSAALNVGVVGRCGTCLPVRHVPADPGGCDTHQRRPHSERLTNNCYFLPVKLPLPPPPSGSATPTPPVRMPICQPRIRSPLASRPIRPPADRP